MEEVTSRTKIIALCLLIGVLLVSQVVVAQETTVVTEDINALNEDAAEHRAQLEQLEKKIEEYNNLIRQKESAAESVANELSILDNRAAKTRLDLEATSLEIDAVDAEIRVLDAEINQETRALERQREIMTAVLKEMGQLDDLSLVEMIFSNENFSDLFDQLSELESVHSELSGVLEETKQTRARLEGKRLTKEDKLASLQDLEERLKTQQQQLDQELAAKETILYETHQDEAQYRSLVYELRQEQQYVDQLLLSLQREIDDRIAESDDFGGDATLLTWPVNDYIITSLYHDPSYPFRHLFEHSGLDLAVPQGTPVESAGPGYVAVARTGRMYGNYIMVIHGNGVATLYAHLSRIMVEPDQFVARGDTIAYSGGLPGTQGAGFSTGPHLHFEVRIDGIPVDPFGYLVSE